MLSREAAEAVMVETAIMYMPIDTPLFVLRVSRIARALRPLQIVPDLTTKCAHEIESDLQGIRKKAPRLARWRRVRRALQGMPYKAAVKARRYAGSVERVDPRFADTVGETAEAWR